MLRAESPEKPALNARIRLMAIDIGQAVFERQQQVVIARRDQTATPGMIGVPTTIASGPGHMLTMEAPGWSKAILHRHPGAAAN